MRPPRILEHFALQFGNAVTDSRYGATGALIEWRQAGGFAALCGQAMAGFNPYNLVSVPDAITIEGDDVHDDYLIPPTDIDQTIAETYLVDPDTLPVDEKVQLFAHAALEAAQRPHPRQPLRCRVGLHQWQPWSAEDGQAEYESRICLRDHCGLVQVRPVRSRN